MPFVSPRLILAVPMLSLGLGCQGLHEARSAPAASVLGAPDGAVLPGGEPMLRMPFEAGQVVLCQQGNASLKPRSHSYPNTRYALDLSAPGTERIEVVAAAAGSVERVVSGAAPGADSPGDGFGNHVVVRHANGYRTAYSHLGDIFVAAGAVVVAGERLGTMSNTGKAGNAHLHFSMHASLGDKGLPDSVPMHGLVASDEGEPSTFRLRTGLELICADSVASAAGRLYGSENRPHVPVLLGAPEGSLAGLLAARRAERERDTPSALTGEVVNARVKEIGPAAARDELLELVRRRPSDAIARYWAAVIAQRDLGDDARAAPELRALEAEALQEPPWLMPWVRLRVAFIEARLGHTEAARGLLYSSLEHTEQGADFRMRALEALRRLPPAPVPALSADDGPLLPCGAGTGKQGSTCIVDAKGRKGVVVFLHGKYTGQDDLANRAIASTEATRAGYSLLAVYGVPGLCRWESKPSDHVCFPQEDTDGVEARRLGERIERDVRRFEKAVPTPGPRFLIGYSNGAFMASKMVAEGLASSFDGVAILFGGLRGVVPRYQEGIALTQRLVLAAATDDPHHAVTMAELARGLGEGKHAYEWFSRPGGHALQAADVRRALELLPRAYVDQPTERRGRP